MSKKSSLDILGESHMPADLFTPTLGSNYGLDGFEDMQYGMGVLEGVLDPQYTEAPALPTGVQLASAEGMDLNAMMEDEVPLTDLSWLDPSQLQDPARLPHIPISIPELEEAWGRSTDGVRVWERDLDDANRERSLRETPDKKAKLTPDHIRKVVGHAMRRSVQGHDIKAIMKEALESVGSEAENLLPYLKPMREEHGLAGKVFIRASAYPNWGTGKWAAEAKKHASRAQYLVVSERDLQGATWIEGGRCKYTSKLAVTEVPWNDALAHYKPLLESTGRRVAGSDPKRALQAAFLSFPEKKQISSESLPVHIAPSQRVGKNEARETFANYQPEKVVYDPTATIEARKRDIAAAKISKLALANMISVETKNKILSSGASPEEMLRLASAEATRTKSGVYSGDAESLNALQALDDSRSRRRARELEASTQDLDKRTKKEFLSRVAKVQQEINRGLRGTLLKTLIEKTISRNEAPEALRILKVSNETLQDTRKEDRVYDKSKFTRYASEHREAAIDVEAVKKASEMSKVATWLRRTMAEGFAGKDLDDLISKRLSDSVRNASESKVREVRAQHEGVSGFLYVDAEAYASPSGVTGCEQGALKHRANKISSVAEMPRCATCAMARVLEDGTRKCGVYNKVLMDFSGEDLSKIQTSNIRATNMTDVELTTSYFSPTYDPSEFGLDNSVLEGLDLDLPEDQKVSDVTFGGWDF